MNKLATLIFFSFLSFSLAAQTQKTGTKPVAPQTQQKLLKTLNDSASYAIGFSIANMCRQEGISSLNTALVAKAFNDVMSGKTTLLTEPACNTLLNRFILPGYASAEDRSKSTEQTAMKTKNDSVSYAISQYRASFLKQQGVKQLNSTIVVRAVKDVFANKPALMNDMVANNVMNKLMIQIQEAQVKPNITAGKTFLAENKKRPGVKTTASGLQYEIIKQGDGIRPTAADTFVCHYRGTLLNGTEFDASYNRNEPLVMGVSQVIKGWTEALQLMPVGSKYKIYVPYMLAYGPFDNPPIPGGSLLIFEMELLDVKKYKP